MNNALFIKNREKLKNLMQDNSMALLFAGKLVVKSEDENYPFYTNNNFYYMTGITEQDIVLVMTKLDGETKEYLYINDYSEYYQLWRGRQLTDTLAKELSGIDEVRYLSKFDRFIHSMLINNVDTVYLDLGRENNDKFMYPAYDFVERLKNNYPHINIKNTYSAICQMRYVKEEEELDAIKKALSITRLGILEMMNEAKPNINEYVLSSAFSFGIKKRGVKEYSFPTIIASGKNACTLHYEYNDSDINDGDLVLCDLGGKWEHYCSDISRTFPANGKFTEKQKLIYNIVLEANKRGIALSKPGMTGRQVDNEIIVPYFAQELKKLGLIKEDSEARKYYPHSVSHSMGLDNHDVGFNPKTNSCEFLVGSVHTIEPGLYIPEWNIGVRIEDDILITNDGCINLSADIIKEVDEIEAYMANRK